MPIAQPSQRFTSIRIVKDLYGHSAFAWWSQAGSNRRPPACKAGALPAELWPHKLIRENLIIIILSIKQSKLVGLGGLELPTSPLSGVRSNQLSYRPKNSALASLTVQTSKRVGPCLGRHSSR